MRTNNVPSKREPARGKIDMLTLDANGREVLILDDGTRLALVYDRTQPMPAVRANEVDTLLRDSYLASLLAGCRNMEQRQNVLRPVCHTGYTVQDDATTSPAPSAPPQGSPAPATATVDSEALEELRSLIETVDGTTRMQFAALENKLANLTPTVVQVSGREPVTLPANELVHQSVPEVLEALEDGLHPYLTGGPGTGKSRLCVTAFRAMGFDPADIVIFPVSNMDQKNSLLGWTLPTTGEYVKGPLHHAFEGKPTVLEELDAGNGAAMTATNIVLDAPFVTFPNGETLERPEQLFIVGAGNTLGKGGDMMFLRNQMDAATRNRWVFVHVDYDRNIERAVVESILDSSVAGRWLSHCWAIRERLEGERVVFSTRNIRHGALQLRRGRPIESIVASALLPGESDDIVRKSGALNWS